MILRSGVVMLRAEKVSFGYGNNPWLLQNVDFQIAAGEVVGLPGPSGRGKSTLAKLLAGYLSPQHGSILCNDRLLPKNVFCPVQLIFQHPELTMNPRWKLGDSLAEGHPIDEEVLNALNIKKHWLSRFPHELSGGELQRLALARVMNPQTRFLIADEMTAMLDANTQAQIWDAVLKWGKSHKVGILVISHDFHLLKRVTDRVDNLFEDHTLYEQSAVLEKAG